MLTFICISSGWFWWWWWCFPSLFAACQLKMSFQHKTLSLKLLVSLEKHLYGINHHCISFITGVLIPHCLVRIVHYRTASEICFRLLKKSNLLQENSDKSVIELQQFAKKNKPNLHILNKLQEEMTKLATQRVSRDLLCRKYCIMYCFAVKLKT